MSVMEDPEVLVQVDGVRAEIVINRPRALNSLNADVLRELLRAFERVSAEEGVRVCLLSAKGEKSFVSGADIRFMQSLGTQPLHDFIGLGNRVMRVIECCPVPVIAVVQGYCLGGGFELALACDFIVAGHDAKFGLPEVGVGLIPGFGGTQRLALKTGRGVASRLILTGDLLSADQALRCGAVEYLAPSEQLRETALKVAESIASKAPCAVRAAKRVIRETFEQGLLGGLRRESEAFAQVASTADAAEGLEAFGQRRTPVFTGR